MKVRLDKIDIRLLHLLQADASLNNLELAERIDLSPTPCARRVRRLEQEGIITRRVTLLDASRLGLSLTAHIGVTMDRHTTDRFESFESVVREYPEVLRCSVVTGQSADYLVTAVVNDMAHYEQFLLGKLTSIPGVTGVHSSFELRKVVDRTALPPP